MINKKIMMVCLAGASLLSAGLAYADDEPAPTKNLHVTISAKAWNESWSTWQYLNTNPANPPVGTTISSSDNKIAGIVGVTVRYRDFFVSGNYAPPTEFNFADTGETNKRSEGDLNFGYYLHPQIGVSLGYKQVKLDYGATGTSLWTHKFITLGINAAARMGESRFFMYENGAFSLTGSTSTTQDAAFTSAGLSKGTPTYRSLESGLGLSVTRGLILTMGYKFQQVELPYTWSGNGVTENTRDTTNGFIFGMAYTF
jgi:hypothetical protein